MLARPFPIVLVKCWKVANWNAKKLLKNCQKSKSCYLNFKSCHLNFLIFLYKSSLKALFFVFHNNF